MLKTGPGFGEVSSRQFQTNIKKQRITEKVISYAKNHKEFSQSIRLTDCEATIFELRVRVDEYAAAQDGDGHVPGVSSVNEAAQRHEHWLLCGGALREEESDLLAAALGQPAAWGSVALPRFGSHEWVGALKTGASSAWVPA